MAENKIIEYLKKFWDYLKSDSWHSWLVSLLLLYLIIRLIFFPIMSALTGSPLPLVIVESCSMYHSESFDGWWQANSYWYEPRDISKIEFTKYSMLNGLNKGDIILIVKEDNYQKGDIIVYKPNSEALSTNPVIHRVVGVNPVETKGDNNYAQLVLSNNVYKIDETNVPKEKILGKAVFKIPLAGWFKLIWFEPFRAKAERGFCAQNTQITQITLQ
jgi:signal peptidase I